MIEASACSVANPSDAARRWVAGTLSAIEAARFEEHLVTCAACQRSVEFATTVRAALGPSLEAFANRGAPGASGGRSSKRLVGLGIAAALLLTVGGAWLETAPSRALRRLGVPDRPPQVSMAQVRSSGGPQAAAFDTAMAAYAAGRYAAAARRLHPIVAADESAAMPAFFLGASELLQRNPAPAIAAFDLVLSAGPSPYILEARLYRAHAMLLLGEAESASSELRLLAAEPGAVGATARERLGALEAIRRR